MKVLSIKTELQTPNPKHDDKNLYLVHLMEIEDFLSKVVYRQAFQVFTQTIKSNDKNKRKTIINSVLTGEKFREDNGLNCEKIPMHMIFRFGLEIKEEIEKQFFPEEDVFDAPL